MRFLQSGLLFRRFGIGRGISSTEGPKANGPKGYGGAVKNPWFLLLPIPVTFVLGTWQVKRHFWKQDLLQKLDENLHQEPVDLPVDFTPADIQFKPVRVTGTFDHSDEILVGPRSLKGKNGFHLITPMDLEDGRRILINRGWIPSSMKDPAQRNIVHSEGKQTIEGLVRAGETGSYFTPKSDPVKRVFYFVDVPTISQLTKTNGVLLDSREVPTTGYPIGGQTPIQMPNNHMSYFITWYSLCIAFSIMAHKRLKMPHLK